MLRHLMIIFYKPRLPTYAVILVLLLYLPLYLYFNYSYHGPKKLQITSPLSSAILTTKNISSSSSIPSSSSSHRKIIYSFPFNQEFELLEAIFNETGDLIEKYIVLESNYSAFGEHKPRRLYARLMNDSSYLEPYRSKLHYVFLDHFPAGGRQDGWIADRYIRGSLGRLGVSKLVSTLSLTDLILVTDLDEMINRQTIEYLLNPTQNFTEPIGMSFEWSVYGYFWKLPSHTSTVNGCTLRMLRYAFNYDTQLLRDWEKSKNLPKVQSYLAMYPNDARSTVHFIPHTAGWHCSWCFRPENIVIKLISAQNGDFPRWGNYPEKLNLTYISENIRLGRWFDGNSLVMTKMTVLEEKNRATFAPKYFLDNEKKFDYLLRNIYLENNTKKL